MDKKFKITKPFFDETVGIYEVGQVVKMRELGRSFCVFGLESEGEPSTIMGTKNFLNHVEPVEP